MARRLSVFWVVALFAAGGLLVQAASADDTKGCEGLGEYREQMFGLWFKDNPDGSSWLGGRDPFTLSSDDWREAALFALEFQRGLKEIDPPAFAEEWHQARIEAAGLAEQIARAAAESGVMAILAFADPAEKVDALEQTAIIQATEDCADFEDFVRDYDALDGDIDGTPVATPVR